MRRQWWIITRQLRPAARFKSVLRGAKGLPQSPGGARHPTKCCTERKNLQAKQIKRGGWGGTHWSCKHATWWTISAAVRNLMIQTDARRFSYQPPWKNSSVDGERRPFSSGGGKDTCAPLSFYLHHSNFFPLKLGVQSSVWCAPRNSLFWLWMLITKSPIKQTSSLVLFIILNRADHL